MERRSGERKEANTAPLDRMLRLQTERNHPSLERHHGTSPEARSQGAGTWEHPSVSEVTNKIKGQGTAGVRSAGRDAPAMESGKAGRNEGDRDWVQTEIQ